MLRIFLRIPTKHSDELAGKKLELSLSFNNIRWGTTKRDKWPSYDVEGHEDDFIPSLKTEVSLFNISHAPILFEIERRDLLFEKKTKHL